MKLISLKINWFKNLNTGIDFTKSEWVSVFVWNNWSWKSNVLEAISAIFYGLYDETNKRRCAFTYLLEYVFEWKNIKIQQLFFKWKKDAIWKIPPEILDWIPDVQEELRIVSFYIDWVFSKTLNRNFIPSNIIALYSGEETRLYEDYYLNDYDKYIKDIITSKKWVSEEVSMSFIWRDFWNIALLTMAISDYDLTKIIWDYKVNKLLFQLNEHNLKKFNKENSNEVTAFVLWISEIEDINLENFKEKFAQTHKELFKLLSVAYLPKEESYNLIKTFDLELANWENTFLASCLSEWQKKQILIYFVTEILANKDSIVLLDEPDSYIHVWNKKRLKWFFDDFLETWKEWEFIMTTHSPTLMNEFKNEQIFDLEKWKVIWKERREVLKNLVWDWMSPAEQQAVLNTTKDILIVEWKTDEIYIETALKKLKEDNEKYNELDFEFILLWWTDPDVLERLSEKFSNKEGQKIIALFDRDDAGLKCIKECLKKSINKDSFNWGKIKNIDIYFYPKKDWFSDSDFEVEDYFNIDSILQFMYPDWIKTFKNTKSKLNKWKFSNYCEELPKEEFGWFKALFDLILKIKEED